MQFLVTDQLQEFTDTESDEDESFVAGMWWGFSNNEDQEFPPSVYRTPTLSAAVELLAKKGEGLDLCEICGGAARTLKVALWRCLKAGRNFDLVAECDLGDLRMQREFKNSITWSKSKFL